MSGDKKKVTLPNGREVCVSQSRVSTIMDIIFEDLNKMNATTDERLVAFKGIAKIYEDMTKDCPDDIEYAKANFHEGDYGVTIKEYIDDAQEAGADLDKYIRRLNVIYNMNHAGKMPVMVATRRDGVGFRHHLIIPRMDVPALELSWPFSETYVTTLDSTEEIIKRAKWMQSVKEI